MQEEAQKYFLNTCMMESLDDLVQYFDKATAPTEIRDTIKAKFPVKLDGPETGKRTDEQQRLMIARARAVYTAAVGSQEASPAEEETDLDRPLSKQDSCDRQGLERTTQLEAIELCKAVCCSPEPGLPRVPQSQCGLACC